MAGVHTTYRTTKGIGSNYVGMEGKLKLPSAYGARPNDANYKNGAFPEFMYGFYPTSISNKGCDCGIVCYPGGFKLFIADNGNGTFTESWKESPNYLSVAKGADVTLRVILTYRKLNIECLVDSVVKGTIFCSFVNDNICNALM